MSLYIPRPTPVVFLAWTIRGGRANEIAAQLDGKALTVFPYWAARFTPLRYLVSFVVSVVRLMWNRPSAVIATNPAVFAAFAAWIYCSVRRIPFLMDAHPVAFGAKGNRAGQVMLPLTRFLARRACLTLVTTSRWVVEVESWGGRAIELHEAPPAWFRQAHLDSDFDLASTGPQARMTILYVGIFGGDEPINEVLEAATQCPELEVIVLGDLKRAEPGIKERAPQNVTFPGYLGPSEYLQALTGADVVCSLTTEPTSVMRAAYEAVYARKPLVVTDTPGSDALFPHAVRVDNSSNSIAQGWRGAIASLDRLNASTEEALELQITRWNLQYNRLQAAIGS